MTLESRDNTVLFLVLILVVSLFTACESTPESEDPPVEPGNQAEQVDNGAKEDEGYENQLGPDGMLTPLSDAGSDTGAPVSNEEATTPSNPVDEAKAKRLDKFQAMLGLAAEYNIREEYASAMEVIDAALADNPPDPLGPRFSALKARVKRNLLRRAYLETFVRFFKDEYTVGDIIEGEIILMNISDSEVFIPATVQVAAPKAKDLSDDEVVPENGNAKFAESHSMVRSEMTYHEFISTNTLVTNRKTRNFRIPADIRLKPGGVHRIPVTVDTREMNPGGTMYRTYELTCSLHAAQITVGRSKFQGSVSFRPAKVGVFPRNAEHLKKDPVLRMQQALAKNSPVHLTLAAAFVDRNNPNELKQAYEFLQQELEQKAIVPDNANGVMMALVIISGLEETKSKDDWLSWLKNREWTKTKN